MESLAKWSDTWLYGNTDFAKFGAIAMPYIIDNIKKGGLKKRGALRILEQVNDPDAVPGITDLSKSNEEDIRIAAKAALENFEKK